MSKPILYNMPYSPPSRFAVITAMTIGLDAEIREVDMLKGEHMTPEYKAINPTSTVPALVDGDTNVFDSSAIAIYLVEKYARDDTLYPKDLKSRTKVNERLFYVSSYMFPRLFQIVVPGYHGKETEIPQDKIDGVIRGYTTIETFLNGNDHLAGETLTLSDLSLWCLMESLSLLIPIDQSKFPNFVSWMQRMKDLPTYSLNKQGADDHIACYKSCISKALSAKSD